MECIKSLILRITERCNLNCAYCYAADSGCGCSDMTPELAILAVSECCPEGGALRIQFTGGEPLLNLDVMEAVYAYGKQTGRRLSLAVQTNGTLLTPQICRRLKAMNCAVGVSLDGLGDANRYRVFPDGTPAFARIMEGIRNLGEVRIQCNLTTVVTDANAAALGQLGDLALWMGNVSGVGLDLFRPLGRGQERTLSPCEKDLSLGLRELIRKAKQFQKLGIPFRLRELERLKRRQECTGCADIYCYAQINESLCVDGDGNCWPCSSLAGMDGFLLGNIREGLPSYDRASLPLFPGDGCRACPSYSLCLGGCPAGRVNQKGDPLSAVCMMNRILMEECDYDTNIMPDRH